MRSSLGELTALLSTCCLLLEPCLLLLPCLEPCLANPALCCEDFSCSELPLVAAVVLCLAGASWLACLPESSNLFVGCRFCLPDAWLPDICLPDTWLPDTCLPDT